MGKSLQRENRSIRETGGTSGKEKKERYLNSCRYDYTTAALLMLSDHKWDADKQLKVVSNIRKQDTGRHMEQILGKVAFQIPYSSEVEAQFLEGELLGELGRKESRAFRREIEIISREVFGV